MGSTGETAASGGPCLDEARSTLLLAAVSPFPTPDVVTEEDVSPDGSSRPMPRRRCSAGVRWGGRPKEARRCCQSHRRESSCDASGGRERCSNPNRAVFKP